MLVFARFCSFVVPRVKKRVDTNRWKWFVPLLDLVEALEERDRDKNEDCLLAVADLDL